MNWWDGLGYEYVGEWNGMYVFVVPWEGPARAASELDGWKYERGRVRAAYERFGGDGSGMVIRFVSREDAAVIHDGIIKKSKGEKPCPTAPNTVERKGVSEQPEPVCHGGGYVYERVIEDMRVRADVGLARYGTYLQAYNGRDGLRDAYEEVLDLAVYLRQVIDERDERMREAGELMKKYGV